MSVIEKGQRAAMKTNFHLDPAVEVETGRAGDLPIPSGHGRETFEVLLQQILQARETRS